MAHSGTLSYDTTTVLPEIATADSKITFSSRELLSSNLEICMPDSKRRMLTSCYNYFEAYSQPTTIRFWESSSTLLNKIWYTYSYIYKIPSPPTTFIIILLLLLLVLLLMSTTFTSIHTIPGIVSLSPNPLSKTRSFTAMSDFTTVTAINFEFGPCHSPQLVYLDTTLKNVYSEPFEDVTLASLFTNTNHAAFNANGIDLLRSAIIAIVVNNS